MKTGENDDSPLYVGVPELQSRSLVKPSFYAMRGPIWLGQTSE